jgi:sulfite exporter TauE/SafE
VIPAALGVLGASLLGSVHCAAMCGGFVCFYAGSNADRPGSGTASHVAYNAGRLASYVTLGALAGSIGAGVTKMGALAGVGRSAAIVAGALMVCWGVSTLAAQRGHSLASVHAPLAWQRALGTVLKAIASQPPLVRAGATGLFTTLLPCGWLYAFVVTAGGSGNARDGALLMLLFWLGTVPALVAVGVGARRIFGPVRRRLPMAGAAAVVVMGLLAMTGRLNLMSTSHAMPASSAVSTLTTGVMVAPGAPVHTTVPDSTQAVAHGHGH